MPTKMSKEIFLKIRTDAEDLAKAEPQLAFWLRHCILQASNWEEVLAWRLAARLDNPALPEKDLRTLFIDILKLETDIAAAAAADVVAINARDPACHSLLTPVLFFKGFHAVTAHRFAHYLWKNKRNDMALYFQSIASQILAVDIHPAARLGRGILLDHATGVVIGETAVIEDNVSILHAVTLGGTGKERGDRHPKVRSNVSIGAGAKLLGNIEIGEGAKIGAGAIVVTHVNPDVTMAGERARVVTELPEEYPPTKLSNNFH